MKGLITLISDYNKQFSLMFRFLLTIVRLAVPVDWITSSKVSTNCQDLSSINSHPTSDTVQRFVFRRKQGLNLKKNLGA
jgi:hypothetical protein